MTDRVTIKIPRPLYEKLKQIIQGTSYSSVTEFVKNPKIPRWFGYRQRNIGGV